jgi:hypothetical protein
MKLTNPHPRLSEVCGLEWGPGEVKEVPGAFLRNPWAVPCLEHGVLTGNPALAMREAVAGLPKDEAQAFAQGKEGQTLARLAKAAES